MNDQIEDPSEINPAHLAKDWRADLLLKNPASYTVNDDGTQTHHVPDPRWLEWSEVPLIRDTENCQHTFSVCSDCADSWALDYYMRFIERASGVQVWISPDHPDVGDQGENPPLYNID